MFLFSICISIQRLVYNKFSIPNKCLLHLSLSLVMSLSSLQIAIPVSCIIWLMYFVLGLPLNRIPFIIPSNIKLCNSSPCLNVCPIIRHLLLFRVSNNVLFILLSSRCGHLFFSQFKLFFNYSFASFSNTIFLALLIYLSFLFSVHISLQYKTTLKTYVFMNLFLVTMLIFLDVINFLFLRNEFFTCPILLLIFFIDFPSFVIMLLKYLK